MTNDEAKQFIDDMRDKIIGTEMPMILKYLVDLETFAQGHGEQIQIETQGLELILLEIVGVTYRLMNLVGQLVGSEKLLELLDKEPVRVGSSEFADAMLAKIALHELVKKS